MEQHGRSDRHDLGTSGVVEVMDRSSAGVLPRTKLGTFDAFYEDHLDQLFRAMFLITGNAGEAEDLAQEAFVRVFERWDRVSRLDSPAGYLYRVGLNLHRTHLRRARVAARKLWPRPSDDAIGAADDRSVIRDALHRLPGRQRSALILVDWLGLTTSEAARILRTTPAAIRTRLSRARKAMRALLEERDA